jgi:hypothetical protein
LSPTIVPLRPLAVSPLSLLWALYCKSLCTSILPLLFPHFIYSPFVIVLWTSYSPSPLYQ